MNKHPHLEIKNLSLILNNQTILENINLSFKQPFFLGIIGPNGGGKTTLIKLINKLIKPTTGKIHNEYLNLAQTSYIAQTQPNFDFFVPITVKEIIATGLTLRNPNPFSKQIKDQTKQIEIQKFAKLFNLEPILNQHFFKLSGGQKQKTLLARALAQNPKLLILDEPTTGIDQTSKHNFYSLLDHLHYNLNISIIVISHEQTELAHHALHILELDHKPIFFGTSKSFLQQKSKSHD